MNEQCTERSGFSEMENEARKDRLFPNGIAEPATYCDDNDEESICNCENNERVTPYYSDEANGHCAGCSGIGNAKQSYQKIKNSCKQIFARLKKDWKACGKNTHIKQTTICRVELYKSKNDTTPIDTFQAQKTKECSLRAMALLGVGLLIVTATAKHFFKK